ncbi:MAG: MotA/TolQ/ExbB proton channel family protein [Pseudomonadota bacterium]
MTDLLNPLLEFVQLGGPVVAILLFLSVGALALIGLKALKYFTCNVGRHKNANLAIDHWKKRNRIEAIRSLSGTRSALEKTILASMERMNSGTPCKEDLEDEISTIALRELHELQRGFRALEAIAQIAPLLGLFGTVLGMIDAFQKLQSAGNSVDPSILAGGIWVALLTTAAGLAVAMPISLVLTWFETRVEDERVAIQTITSKLIANNFALPENESSEEQSNAGVAYAN